MSQLQKREGEYKSQLDELKAAANAANRAALDAAAAAASTSGRVDGGDGGAAAAAARAAGGRGGRDAGGPGGARHRGAAAAAGRTLSEHILYVGPPGTAKSELGRRLSRLCHGTYFERLLTRFSVPEELFGPLSMRALEEDRYIRQDARVREAAGWGARGCGWRPEGRGRSGCRRARACAPGTTRPMLPPDLPTTPPATGTCRRPRWRL